MRDNTLERASFAFREQALLPEEVIEVRANVAPFHRVMRGVMTLADNSVRAGVARQPGSSRWLQDRVVRLAGGVSERRLDVIRLKAGKVAEDFIVRHALGQDTKNVCDADTQPPNTGPPAAFARFDRDTFQKFHVLRIPHCAVRDSLARVAGQ